MFKTAGRLINFRTLFLVVLYVFLKSDKKNITTYEIKEESMSPALLPEDYVVAIKNKDKLNRGDIVIFKNHEKNIDVIKRVIGLPGETVSSENGKVLINNSEIDDIWLKLSQTILFNKQLVRMKYLFLVTKEDFPQVTQEHWVQFLQQNV